MKKDFKKPLLSMVAIKGQSILVGSTASMSGGGNGNGAVAGAKVAGNNFVSPKALAF